MICREYQQEASKDQTGPPWHEARLPCHHASRRRQGRHAGTDAGARGAVSRRMSSLMTRFFKHSSIFKSWSGILGGVGIVCLAVVTYVLALKSPNDANALSTAVLAGTLGGILW